MLSPLGVRFSQIKPNEPFVTYIMDTWLTIILVFVVVANLLTVAGVDHIITVDLHVGLPFHSGHSISANSPYRHHKCKDFSQNLWIIYTQSLLLQDGSEIMLQTGVKLSLSAKTQGVPKGLCCNHENKTVSNN